MFQLVSAIGYLRVRNVIHRGQKIFIIYINARKYNHSY